MIKYLSTKRCEMKVVILSLFFFRNAKCLHILLLCTAFNIALLCLFFHIYANFQSFCVKYKLEYDLIEAELSWVKITSSLSLSAIIRYSEEKKYYAILF